MYAQRGDYMTLRLGWKQSSVDVLQNSRFKTLFKNFGKIL